MSELINEWNQVIDYKIIERDLKQPTYEFFYNALESLLTKLNVNVNAIKARIPEQDFERLFNIAFVNYVDALYKISNPANRLYYMDLIRPSAKKCTHVLKTLLNYLHYVEMVKNQVHEHTSTLLKEYNDTLTERNDLLTKNELMKQRSNKINEQLERFTEKIPQHEATIKELNEKRKALADEKLKLLDDIKKMEGEQLKLDLKKTELAQQVVADDEYEGLCQVLSDLKEECNEIKKLYKDNQLADGKAEEEMKVLKGKCEKLMALNDAQQKKHIVEASQLLVKLDVIKKKCSEATRKNEIVDHSVAQLEKLLDDISIEYKKLEEEVLELADEELKLDHLTDRKEMLLHLSQLTKTKYQEYYRRFTAINKVNEYLLAVWQRVLDKMLSTFADHPINPDGELIPDVEIIVNHIE